MAKIHIVTFIKLPNCRFLPRKASFIFIEGDVIYSIVTGHVRSDIMTMQVLNIKDFLYITSIMSCLKEKEQNVPYMGRFHRGGKQKVEAKGIHPIR